MNRRFCCCHWLVALALVALLSPPPPCNAQPVDPFVQPWQLDSFFDDVDLTEKYVLMAATDRQGGMWFSMSDGLYHYDGYRWLRYTTKHGLPSNYVRCVTTAPDGTVWVGTDQGAGTFEDGVFQFNGTKDQLAGPSVRRIVVDTDGSVWFCCDQWPEADVAAGLTRLQSGEFRSWTVEDGLPTNYVSDYFRDSRGQQFVLTRKGLAQFRGDGFALPLVEAGMPDCQTYIWSMVETENDGLLVGTADHFFKFQNEKWTAHKNRHRRLDQPKLAATGDGEIVTVGYGGGSSFYRWQRNRMVPISLPMTYTAGGTQFLVEDDTGAVWVGGYERLMRWQRINAQWTRFKKGRLRDRGPDGDIWCEDADGMNRYADGRWTHYPGFRSPTVSDSKDNLWLTSDDGLIRWIGEDKWETIRFEGISNSQLQWAGGPEVIWVSGRNEQGIAAVARWDSRQWRIVDLPLTDPSESVVGIGGIRGSAVWALTAVNRLPPFRLFFVTDDELIDVNLPSKVNVSNPPQVAVMDDGMLLVGGVFGLLASNDRGATWTVVETPTPAVRQLRRLGRSCWASFSGHAGGMPSISRFRDGNWTNFPSVQGRFAGRDRRRGLLLSTLGMLQIIPEDSDELPPPITMPFTNRAGRVVPDNDGNLWVANGTELFRYRPAQFPPETIVDDRDEHLYDGDGLSLRVRGRERYRPTGTPENYFVSTQIDGGSWSPMQPLRSQLSLGVLEQGPHRIAVRLMNEAGGIDPSPAVFQVEVLPLPIQMRAWFKPVVTLGVLTIACLACLAMLNWFTIRRLAGDLKEEVARRGKRLNASEREYQTLFEDSQDAICLFASEGRVKACNTAATELLGMDADREVTLSQLFSDPEDASQLHEKLQRYGALKGMRCRIRKRAGDGFEAMLSANTLTDSEGNLVGHQVIIRDISDLVDLQSRLRQTQTMEAVGRMAGGIAHDFNNFLAVVMYGADFIRLQKPDDEEIDKGVQMILDGAQRAKKLTSQIQTLSRAPSPKPGIIETGELLENLPDLLCAILPANVELTVHVDDELGRIQADPQQIEQVLVNLAVNAAHAMPDGGKLSIVADNIRIQQDDLKGIECEVPNDSSTDEVSMVRLTVVDTGHGIEESVRQQVFEPFFTTKPRGKGTGLGLAIVYGIIQQLRGTIRLESRVGKGTKFEILFPRVELDLTEHTVESSDIALHGHESILLVEDEDDIRELASRSLRSYGYDVHVAEDGEVAMQMIAKLHPLDLVISDIVMKESSGYDLVKHIRRERPEVHVLLVSGYPQQSQNGMLSDIDVPFLRKPFVPAVLASRVRQLLDAAAAKQSSGKAIA